ncbi:MAG: Uma2 family endonuclease [Aphanocapsa lilacina HA4352-LM1]|jgi:Uma2 family endonuclease|nr:Uma2 family endonuclease [Aphanocapsa lilacina HA4352-LM1]
MVSQPSIFTSALPDHTQLPESDGTFVKNFQEHSQSVPLTDSIRPRLEQLHPDGHYAIGQDSGIYWRLTEPPERGALAPDWFYVPDVVPLPPGQYRRSYVLWQELIPPLVVLEFVSGDGSEERDATPYTGKFWIYERVIRPAYYGIYEVQKAAVEVYELAAGRYRQLASNCRGHFPIEGMGVELPWLRWWDADGQLLLCGWEQVERLEQRAELAEQRSAALAQKLRELGVDPDQP